MSNSIVFQCGYGEGENARILRRDILWGVFDTDRGIEIECIDDPANNPDAVDDDGEALEPLGSDDAALGLVVRLALDGLGLAHEQAVAALLECGIEVRYVNRTEEE